MGKSKSTQKTKSSTNETSTATPWGPATAGLTDLAGMTSNAMHQAQNIPLYQGDFVAQPGAMQQNVAPLYQQASQLAGGLVGGALNAANTTNWQMPSFQGSPTLQDGTQTFGSYDASQVQPVIEAAMQPYMRQLTEQVLPGLQSAGIESGAYSNDRAFAVMPQQALRDTSRMAAEVGSGIAFQDFMANQQRQQQAYQMSTQRGLGEADVLTQRLAQYPELLDTAMRMSTGQADLASQGAAYDTALRQSEINNALAQDAYNVQAPFRGLDMASSIFGSFAPYATRNNVGTSNSTTTQTTQQPLAGQLLQGAMGIGSMALGMPGGFAGLGTALGIGQAAGAAGGGYNMNAINALPNPFTRNLFS